jgi:hypothetical protein
MRACSLVALMTAVILLQVCSRYLLGSALTWSAEVTRFMMVWMISGRADRPSRGTPVTVPRFRGLA